MQGQDDHARRAVLESEIARLRQKLLQIAGINVMNQFDRDLLNSGTPEPVNSSLPQRMSNAEVAHELLLDPSLTLSVTSHSAAGASLRNRSAGDSCETSLPENTGYRWQLILKTTPQPMIECLAWLNLSELSGLDDLTNSEALHNLFNDLLDVGHIRAQIQGNAYDWKSCVELVKTQKVFGIMKEMQYSEQINF